MSDAEPTSGASRAAGTSSTLRIAVAATVGVIWAVYMLAVVALGGCDSFGGRCDGTRPPLFEDDVAGKAFVGTAVATWMLWWLRRPSVRQAAVGVAVALAVAAVVALLARSLAHG
ncbi:hypothetical protein [Ilumatobacter coccineus]|uniref:hypothetical protein n=1 Tax=Ilumatobacter coccineus TaxID=467094 RepID=UPI0012B6928C|nr:hypothetical protein [Ilumatobacter coccineus]